jgi:hypothetical protein
MPNERLRALLLERGETPACAQFPVGDQALFLGAQVQGWKGPYPMAYLVPRPQLRRDEDVRCAWRPVASAPAGAVHIAVQCFHHMKCGYAGGGSRTRPRSAARSARPTAYRQVSTARFRWALAHRVPDRGKRVCLCQGEYIGHDGGGRAGASASIGCYLHPERARGDSRA